MEKKKGKFDFKLMTSLGKLNDEQFKVMFFILNTINLNGGNRTKIYRAVLADICGKSERTISRITDKLAEQGLIVKDSVSDGSKLYNYYALPMTKNKEKVDNEKQKTESISVIDDRVNTSNTIKTINTSNTIKNNNIIENNNIKKEFKIECNNENLTTMEGLMLYINETLTGETEDDLINQKGVIMGEFNKNRIPMGTSLYNRASSYLNRKYQEKLELVTAEAQ